MKMKDIPDEEIFPLNPSTGYASVSIQKLCTVMLMYYGFTLDNGEALCVCGSKVGDVSLRYIDCGQTCVWSTIRQCQWRKHILQKKCVQY